MFACVQTQALTELTYHNKCHGKTHRIEISRMYKVRLAEYYRAITLIQMYTTVLTDKNREIGACVGGY